MTATHPVPDASASRLDERAEQLAQLLRTSRFVTLVGDAGSGKSALLKAGVLPCLHRRACDRAAPVVRRDGDVIYLPDRRKDASTRDITIYFDAWGASPLRALSMVVDAALFERFGTPPDMHVPVTPFGWLAEKLAAASRASRVRFLIVLDAFDVYLEAPPGNPEVVLFDEELVEMINAPGLAAHVLIAFRPESEPAFERIRSRVVDTDAFMPLAMPPEVALADRDGGDDVVARAEILAAAPAGGTAAQSEPPMEVSTAEAAAAERTASTGTASAIEAVPVRDDASGPIDDGAGEAVVADSDDATIRDLSASLAAPAWTWGDDAEARAAGARADPAWTPPRRALLSRALGRPGPFLAMVIVVCAAVVWFRNARTPAPVKDPVLMASVADSSPRGPEPAATAASALPGAGLELLVDPDSAGDRRIADELRNRVARGAGLDLQVRPATRWSDAFEPGADVPRVAIVRYDALEAARRAAKEGPRAHRIEIVMPLYMEPVLVVVRRDQPITAVHEIEGLRINTGPEQGARAMTADRLYRGLFGASLPAGLATHDGQRDAMAKLVAGDGVDALVAVGSDLDGLFADRTAWKARVKLLRLDRDDPASRRALRTFLPTVVGRDASAGLVDGDLPALSEVAFLIASTPDATDRAERDARLAMLATGLCEQLPTLRRDGDRKWNEVRIGARLDVGWPYAEATDSAFRACASPGDVALSSNP